jgi:acetyl esterase
MLDPDSAALLAARRKAAIPPVAQQTLAEVRGSRKEWRVATPAPKLAVDAVWQEQVAVEGGHIGVRLYRTRGEARRPAVMYLHGGGWVLGDLEHSDALCRHLAVGTGFVVINVDYRLAPEHRYPTAAKDSFAAFRWAIERAGLLGIDPGRIAVAGGSAGGNLAAAVTLMARDAGEPRPAAQLLAYPCLEDACSSPSYAEFGEGHIVATEDMRWYWRQYLEHDGQGAEPLACPLKAKDLSGLPPALIITAECDPIRDDGERYAARLREAGVPVILSRYPGTLHGFFALPGAFAKGTAAVAEASQFLVKTLGDPR